MFPEDFPADALGCEMSRVSAAVMVADKPEAAQSTVHIPHDMHVSASLLEA